MPRFAYFSVLRELPGQPQCLQAAEGRFGDLVRRKALRLEPQCLEYHAAAEVRTGRQRRRLEAADAGEKVERRSLRLGYRQRELGRHIGRQNDRRHQRDGRRNRLLAVRQERHVEDRLNANDKPVVLAPGLRISRNQFESTSTDRPGRNQPRSLHSAPPPMTWTKISRATNPPRKYKTYGANRRMHLVWRGIGIFADYR